MGTEIYVGFRSDFEGQSCDVGNQARLTLWINGGSLDVVDLYRFGVARRSALDLRLHTRADRHLSLTLTTDRGGELARAFGSDLAITRRIDRGRYSVIVRSFDNFGARYVLARLSRTITTTATRIDGRRFTAVRPKTAVDIGVRMLPTTFGPATVTLERFDPIEGWLPYRTRAVTVRNGTATLRWMPPTPGRWRAKTQYLGTRLFAPSTLRFAVVRVANPLDSKGTGSNSDIRSLI